MVTASGITNMSKVIVVTGSRDWRNQSVIHNALISVQQEFPEETITLRQGCASGADAIARSLGEFFCFDIEDYWPDYTSYEFAEANKVRNIEMLNTNPIPFRVLAFPTKRSRGTWHCVNNARKIGIEVVVYEE